MTEPTSAAAAFVAELRARVAAGTPIVWVVTPEERAARSLLAEAFGADAVVSWTSARGLDGHEALREPTAAIARAAGSTSPVRVFYDLHPYMSDPRVVRALRDHAVVGRDKPSAFVVVSPMVAVPAELERDVAMMHLPLPDRAEVGALLDAEIGRSPGIAQESAALEALVRAALGLTRDQASRAFRRGLAGGDAVTAVARVLEEKRDALRSASALELMEPDVTLDDVGGLEVLKAWLRSRVLAFDEAARTFGLTEPRGMLVCGVQGCGKSLVS